MRRKAGSILLLAMAVLFLFICTGCQAEDSGKEEASEETSDSEGVDTERSADEVLKEILQGEASFHCVSEGHTEEMTIMDVPALFDADDPTMMIWQYALADLDGDGEEEAIFFVVGAAGDTGGKVILHRIGDKVYGYLTDSRTLVDLKTDGSFYFSDPTGVAEAGIAVITGFSETDYTMDIISRETGNYEGWSAFTAEHQPATEEEYLEAVARQDKKQNVEWYESN